MLKDIHAELEKLKATGKFKEFYPVERLPDGQLQCQGRSLVNLTSWDILGLNEIHSFKRAVQSALENGPLNCGSPRLVSGTSLSHLACERRIARFLGSEAAVLFSSKNQAVLSLAVALFSEGDLVLVPEAMHSPVIDAAGLVNAEVRNFSPGEVEKILEELLRSNPKRRCFLFSETLAPLSGELYEILEIDKICNKYGVVTIWDESYALGLVGPRGAGGFEHFSLLPGSGGLRVGDLSLGLGGFGAFVAGSTDLIDYLINSSKTFLNEVALPPPVCEGCVSAIDLVELMGPRRQAAAGAVARLGEAFKNIGFSPVSFGLGPILSLGFSKKSLAEVFSRALLERGFLTEVLSRGCLLSEAACVRMLIPHSFDGPKIEGLIKAVFEVNSVMSE